MSRWGKRLVALFFTTAFFAVVAGFVTLDRYLDPFDELPFS